MVAPVVNGFAELGASPETVAALAEMGITQPFPVQALTLPLALAGNDVIGQARTGTGKTLAFGVPLLDRLGPQGSGVQALVVVPTRELCVQVASDLSRAGSTRGTTVLAIYGGRAFEPQVESLRKGVDVVVGTPGRLLDLARQGHLDLSAVRSLVLDEADEMLDLGFLPDVERIVALIPTERQTLLYSATMPGPIITLARRFMRQPVHMRAEDPTDEATVPTTQQHVLRAHALDKVELLGRLLQAEGRGLAMVFCRTKRQCDKLAEDLADRGFAAEGLHGDLAQAARERVLRAFRAGKIDVIVATDVAARGIDVQGVTHVVNYHCPDDEKTYLHRIGRTGRAGESGVAVTFVDWEDLERWKEINRLLGLPFEDLVETYSTSPHYYESLDIPAGTTGRLPRSQRTRAGLGAEVLEDIGDTGRKRAPRSGSAGGSSGGRPSGGESSTERAPGRSRSRSRTRGAGTSGESAGAGTSAAAAPRAAGEGTGGDGAASPARRRRRRRGGSGGGGSVATGGDSGGTSTSA